MPIGRSIGILKDMIERDIKASVNCGRNSTGSGKGPVEGFRE
jgi:hypothetical protein